MTKQQHCKTVRTTDIIFNMVRLMPDQLQITDQGSELDILSEAVWPSRPTPHNHFLRRNIIINKNSFCISPYSYKL